ncbi:MULTISPECIES: dTMP kinase [unclassified Sphingomonas]|uniref:dTMP kinase n=1 Tax=unclassified Sphingomonas TaxID=196159 RepID=UPI000928AF83|nr:MULTISPECIES: dTMP kinase [unclassified Sphingomonas]MBN8847648.1 dTMP kinase [Sphingomonas sp.]OJV31501.1 MAG: dTMP kinase [Sphingomonas sp. 67-36]
MTGRFLSLEGGEGAGKSTQARALADALEARGIRTLVTREPGGSEGAEAIRALLMQGDVQRWSPHTEALLFAAARADHVEKTIRPAIGAGVWVICDRYLDSSRAYQGIAGGIDDAAVLALHAFGSRGLLPDRTFVLELPPEEGARRAAGRDGAGADRFAMRGDDFHIAVAAAFDRFATAEPDRFRRIDATRPPEVVTAALLEGLADLLP